MKRSISKFLAAVISLTLIITALLPAASALTPAQTAHVSFNEDGSFRILNFSDFQDGVNFSKLTAAFIRESLEKYEPDLVVFTGDNIAGYTTKLPGASEKAIRNVMDIFEEYKIPVAPCFGNHDDEGDLTKEEQMAIYSEYSCCIGFDEATVSADEPYNDPDLSGVGTYLVPIYESADSDTVKFAVWMFDSGSDDEMEDRASYDHVRADQVEWYKNTSDLLAEQNGGQTVYGIAYQHVVVNEIYNALKEVDKNTDGAVPYQGKWYVLPDNAVEGSVMREAPCPSYENEGEYDAFVERGDVLAVVCGHDHANSYIIPYQGVDIICTATCGFQSYGLEESRGARVFELKLEDGVCDSYETYTYLFTDAVTEDFALRIRYVFINFWKELYLFFNNLMVKIRETIGV